ncbi:hypothetical protein ACFL45_05870 [Candidatus Neomarinimicrobiota bacterium]
MRKSVCILIFTGILLGFSSCHTTEPDLDPDTDFGFYFLVDDTLRTYQVVDQDIDSLVLSSEAFLSDDDIEFYDFSSHTIYLIKDIESIFDPEKFGPEATTLMSKPFVVIADGVRCYIGSIHSGALSLWPSGPYIEAERLWFMSPDDVLTISRAWSGEDVRSMVQIEDALKALDIFHAGLEFVLNSAIVVDGAGGTTVEYTYTLTNNDADDLLVLDPDVMGSDQFHYFTNGVRFNSDGGHYWSANKTVTTPEPHWYSWHSEWFTTIKSGRSIERTVQLSGYQAIPADPYTCDMEFANPGLIKKNERFSNGARYWLGRILSNSIEVVVT